MPAALRQSELVSLATRLRSGAAVVICGVGWTWAVALLATRHHLPGNYGVIGVAPPIWGFLGLPAAGLLVACGLGLLLALAAMNEVRSTGRFWTGPVRWLAWVWVIPGLDLLRLSGLPVPMTFLEPLLVAGLTGGAVGSVADRVVAAESSQWLRRVPWLAIVWVLTVLAGAWWYFDAVRAYDGFLLGYNDFGHFGFRVANTWNGRGFLLETPGLPAFWDHFNPGLALLAPLWGLWPDPKLFLLIQAVCLALPAPAVFGIARHLSAAEFPTSGMIGLGWAGAYLVFPAVGQFNLAYSYGWHPVTLALPPVFFAILALLRGWRLPALVAAVLACSFQEDIVAILACLSLAMAVAGWLDKREGKAGPNFAPPGLVRSLRPGVWLLVGIALAVAFVAIFEFSPCSRYQVGRFSELGNTPWEIVLSPVLRPAAFWGTVLRRRCGYFLLALAIPLGLRPLVRGWPVLLATVIPFGVLLAWNHSPGTSLAFHYATGLVPLLFLAGMTGAAGGHTRLFSPGKPFGTPGGSAGLWRAGVAALAAGATASAAFGAMPWSSPTLTDVVAWTYDGGQDQQLLLDRMPGSPGNRLLHDVVAYVQRGQPSVLATGRIAAHLIAVRRIDTVGQAVTRWKDFAKETGPDRSPIELFDWVVIDAAEQFYQSPEETKFILDAARGAHYELVRSEHGVLVLKKPSQG